MNISDYFVKILRWGIYISLFLPLVIFSQYLSPFHFGKTIIFRILVELMMVFYILLIIANKNYRPKWNLILISFSIFTGLYIFSGLIGVNFYQSLWGTLERMGGIFSFIHFWVYFVILVSIIRSAIDWNKVLKISVFVGFLSILFAYGQHFRLGNFFVGWQHGERVIGTIGNPALFAGYLLFVLYLALLMFLRSSGFKRWFFVSVIILGIPILLITAVRGAVVAFIGSLFLLGIFFIIKAPNRKIKTLLLIGVIIFLILLTVVWLNKGQSWVKNINWLNRIMAISAGTETIQTRLWAWESAIKGWKERPIFGWGPENFMVLHMEYFNSRHFTGMGAETIWDRAHNVVLEMLSTMGVVGLISYLSIFFFLFYFLIKKYKKQIIGKETLGVLSALIIAYFVQNLFIFDTFSGYFMFFLVLGYVGFLSSDQRPQLSVDSTRNPSIFFTAVLLILAVILAYQTNIKPAKANYSATRAILAGRAGEVNRALAFYQRALKYNTPQGAYEIRNKFATFIVEVVEHQQDTNNDFDPNLLYAAIKEIDKNIKEFPLDTTPYLYMGRMYIILIGKDSNAGDLAEESINKAIQLNDKNPRIWYELGQAQLSRKKYQESYQSFKTALNLNPSVTISYWFLGSAAYYLGNYQEAASYVDKAISMGYAEYEDSLSDLVRLIKIYDAVKDYHKIVELYKLVIAIQPNNAQFHVSLAVIYSRIGDFESAIQEARRAEAIDPRLHEDVEKFIKSLGK